MTVEEPKKITPFVAQAITTGAAVVTGLLLAPFADGGRHVFTTCFIGINLASACMVGIWCATSTGWIRFIVFGILLFFWGCLLNNRTGGSDSMWFIVAMMPVAIGAIVTSTVEVVKRAFGHFEIVGASNTEFREGLQFKISQLLILTTGIAFLFAIGKACWPLLAEGLSDFESLLKISTLIAIFSVNALLSIWALLGQRIATRLPVAVALQLVTGTLGHFVFDHLQIHFWVIIVSLGTVATLLHLALLRHVGIRFVRHG